MERATLRLFQVAPPLLRNCRLRLLRLSCVCFAWEELLLLLLWMLLWLVLLVLLRTAARTRMTMAMAPAFCESREAQWLELRTRRHHIASSLIWNPFDPCFW